MRSESMWSLGLVFTLGVAGLALASGDRASSKTTVSSPKSTYRIDPSRPWQHDDGRIQHRGRMFDSWESWRVANPRLDHRCGTPAPDPPAGVDGIAGFGDCSLTSTNPADDYDPSIRSFVIPVVVHVIMNDDGSLGDIGRATIERQMVILNDDFAGTGVASDPETPSASLRFVLARQDPSGAPTTGITRSKNTVWFNDEGEYWNDLAWDPTRYLNVYTNTAGGPLGYVNAFPASGSAGDIDDRVVIDWRVFGEASTYGPPQDLGRILTHEVGHYLGLLHTFQGGCGSSSCLDSGDLICDTPPQSEPDFDCSSSSFCGEESLVSNFMNYSWQACMSGFTNEQIRRMRCTLESYRPLLGMESEVCGFVCEHDLNGDGFVNGSDLGIMLGRIGGPPSDIIQCGDFNLDGLITGSDLGSLLGAWGECAESPCDGVATCDDGDECTVNYCLEGECRSLEISGCGICGGAESGSCYESNGTPGCSNAECCEAICEVDPYCCFVAWDASCRTKALSGNFPECDG